MNNGKITVRIILKSGAQIDVKCSKFTVKTRSDGYISGLEFEGIVDNKPLYLDFSDISAVVRLMSCERNEDENGTV